MELRKTPDTGSLQMIFNLGMNFMLLLTQAINIFIYTCNICLDKAVVDCPTEEFNGCFGPAVRVFANGPGDLGSIPGRVIPKTLKKWNLIPPCLTLSIIRYGSRVKWSNPGNGVAPSPTPWCSSYRKGSLRVTLDYICI